MYNIVLLAVGSIKEAFLKDGISEYLKRLKPFINFEIIEIKESTSNDILKNLKTESLEILKLIKPNDFVISLKIDGVSFDTISFSKYIENHFSYSDKKMVFIIGSSNGLHQDIYSRSNYFISFSKMTFPHQLMRLIFVEQLYRVVSIINNLKYHK